MWHRWARLRSLLERAWEDQWASRAMPHKKGICHSPFSLIGPTVFNIWNIHYKSGIMLGSDNLLMKTQPSHRSGGQQASSAQSPRANILGFVGHTISVTTTQLHCGGAMAATDRTERTRCAVFPWVFMNSEICISSNFRVSWNVLLLIFFQLLKTLKTIFGSWTV